jgi:hypothetical protein
MDFNLSSAAPLTACATDAEVMKFVEKDRIEPSYWEMSEAIDTTCGIDYFAGFKTQTWKLLNSYTHTGMLQIGRRFTVDQLQPSYTDAEKVEVLRVITASVLLLVRPFLARQGHLDSAKEIDMLTVRREGKLSTVIPAHIVSSGREGRGHREESLEGARSWGRRLC